MFIELLAGAGQEHLLWKTWCRKFQCSFSVLSATLIWLGDDTPIEKLNKDIRIWNRSVRQKVKKCHKVVSHCSFGWAVGPVSEKHSGKRGQSVLWWSGKGSKKKKKRRGIVNTACCFPSPSAPSPLCVTASLKPLIPRTGGKCHFLLPHPMASPCLPLLSLFTTILNLLFRLFCAGL